MRPTEQIIASMWKRVMPANIAPPDDFVMFLWSQHPLDDIQYSVQRSAFAVRRPSKLNAQAREQVIRQRFQHTRQPILLRVPSCPLW